MVADDRKEELIVGLYDAALDPERWPDCFSAIRAAVGSTTSIASVLHPTDGQVHMLACNAPDAFVQGYMEHWWREDLWMIEAARRSGRISIGSELMPDDQFVRTTLFNELVKPTSDVRDVLGIVFDIGEWRAVIGLHRPVAGTYGVQEKRLLKALVPHVTRSLDLTLRFDQLAKLTEASQSIVDALSFGIVIVDERCRPLVVNRLARDFLATGDGLTTNPAGQVVAACRRSDTTRLQALLTRAASPVAGAGGALRITRKSDRPGYLVTVTPVVGRRTALFNTKGPAALLIIQDPAWAPVPRAHLLRDLYGLTTAEAALAEALASGKRPEEVAELRCVRISTVRTQLAAILHKTGTARQAELMRLLASLART